MGRDLFGRDPFTDELAARASDGARADLTRLCLRGPMKALSATDMLQPALTVVCLGLWQRLVDAGVTPGVVAGHSLGELPALAASGMADPRGVVDVAVIRGRAMADAAAERAGSMVAATGRLVDDLEILLQPFQQRGQVAVAAVNGPTQATLSGDTLLLDEVIAALRRQPDLKVTSLRVSGAWHSDHMRPAQALFRSALGHLALRRPTASMIFNRHGRPCANPAEVKEVLVSQLVAPVRFDRVMQQLIDLGVTDFIEIGPGKVLRGLIRLNHPDPEVKVHNVSDERSLMRTLNVL